MQSQPITPFFESLPLQAAQAMLWDFYRTWAISAAEHATTEELREHLVFYEQLDDMLVASYATGKLIEETI